ncbi:hypothetical protein [Paraburkholderia phytofirmans]|uniref:Uncharacterized protein n=1 Tax=Paraburkholderia phytofirmans TaxID=261302 RepID=A0ABW9BGG2_9BURK
MDIELPTDDHYEVTVVLIYVRDLIAEAYQYGLSVGELSAAELARRNALHGCNGVLSPDGRLEDGFRTVLSDVLDGRDVWKLTVGDCGKIAVRYGEWLEPPLSSGWRTLAYNSRSDQ